MFGPSSEEDLELVCYIHDSIIDASGGAKGFHDRKLIESALARPMQSAFGEETYPDYFSKAAALIDSIAKNHGFRDGNKRTAMAVADIYLEFNNCKINFTNEEYEDFMLHVVNVKPPIDTIAQWLKDHIA